MEIRKIKYPYMPDGEGENEWYKFGQSDGAVKVNDERIEQWVNECVYNVKTQLEHGVESPYAFSASGDTIVICFFSRDVEDDVFDDDNYFTVIVAKNYEEGTFFLSDIKKKEKTFEDQVREATIGDIIDELSHNKFGNKKVIRTGNYEIEIKERRDF